tara:strand:- start:171 stop:1082 length:912 start_codon:yes stop_codon:yes gene_type:complete
MAFNKIQPEQIQLATFFSDSGDLDITQTDTGVQMNLSRDLTGDFSFTGSLSTNGRSVFGLANTGDNFFITDNNTILLNGANTQIRGTGNSAFLADGSQISGINNVAINVNSVNFIGSSVGVAARNTALHGRGISFPYGVTGSLAMKDFSASSQSVNQNHSLYVNFESGHFFEGGQSHFSKSVSFGESGVISGNLEVIGSGFLTGQEIITKHYLTGYASGNYVNKYGPQTISGEKTIRNSMRFDTGFQLPAYTGTVQGAHYVGIGSSHITTGSLAISGHTLYICVGGTSDNVPKWAGIPISGAL